MQADIQVHSPVFEPRSVFDVAARHDPFHGFLFLREHLCRKKLQQGLESVEGPCSGAVFDDDSGWGDVEVVGLVGQAGVPEIDSLPALFRGFFFPDG